MIKIEYLAKFTKELLWKEIQIKFQDKTQDNKLIQKKIKITKDNLYFIGFDKEKNLIFWLETPELENKLLTITVNVKQKAKDEALLIIKKIEDNIENITTVESLLNL